ncbi:MAG: diaminopimelate epimerase [Bacteroidota bacterium]
MISFDKYHGAGNDFLLLDGREKLPFSLDRHDFIADLCSRRFGVGADGLMVLSHKTDYDFEMHYFNADGHSGSMCGNGGRCIVTFAHKLGIRPQSADGLYHFLAVDGPHRARLLENGQVELEMQPVSDIDQLGEDCILDTGSPHFIRWVPDVGELEVLAQGQSIRYSPTYEKVGINVNFVQRVNGDTLLIRTYERGVEGETYACGTGVTAAAIAHVKDRPAADYQIKVQARGGDLSVRLKWDGQTASAIWLIGPTQHIYSGQLAH